MQPQLQQQHQQQQQQQQLFHGQQQQQQQQLQHQEQHHITAEHHQHPHWLRSHPAPPAPPQVGACATSVTPSDGTSSGRAAAAAQGASGAPPATAAAAGAQQVAAAGTSRTTRGRNARSAHSASGSASSPISRSASRSTPAQADGEGPFSVPAGYPTINSANYQQHAHTLSQSTSSTSSSVAGETNHPVTRSARRAPHSANRHSLLQHEGSSLNGAVQPHNDGTHMQAQQNIFAVPQAPVSNPPSTYTPMQSANQWGSHHWPAHPHSADSTPSTTPSPVSPMGPNDSHASRSHFLRSSQSGSGSSPISSAGRPGSSGPARRQSQLSGHSHSRSLSSHSILTQAQAGSRPTSGQGQSAATSASAGHSRSSSAASFATPSSSADDSEARPTSSASTVRTGNRPSAAPASSTAASTSTAAHAYPYPRTASGAIHKRNNRLSDADRRKLCEYAARNPDLRHELVGLQFNVERSTVSKILKQKHRWLGPTSTTQEDGTQSSTGSSSRPSSPTGTSSSASASLDGNPMSSLAAKGPQAASGMVRVDADDDPLRHMAARMQTQMARDSRQASQNAQFSTAYPQGYGQQQYSSGQWEYAVSEAQQPGHQGFSGPQQLHASHPASGAGFGFDAGSLATQTPAQHRPAASQQQAHAGQPLVSASSVAPAPSPVSSRIPNHGTNTTHTRIGRGRIGRHPDMEKLLGEWGREQTRAGICTPDAVVCQKAREIAESMGIDHTQFKASAGWLDNYKERGGYRQGWFSLDPPPNPLLQEPMQVTVRHRGPYSAQEVDDSVQAPNQAQSAPQHQQQQTQQPLQPTQLQPPEPQLQSRIGQGGPNAFQQYQYPTMEGLVSSVDSPHLLPMTDWEAMQAFQQAYPHSFGTGTFAGTGASSDFATPYDLRSRLPTSMSNSSASLPDLAEEDVEEGMASTEVDSSSSSGLYTSQSSFFAAPHSNFHHRQSSSYSTSDSSPFPSPSNASDPRGSLAYSQIQSGPPMSGFTVQQQAPGPLPPHMTTPTQQTLYHAYPSTTSSSSSSSEWDPPAYRAQQAQQAGLNFHLNLNSTPQQEGPSHPHGLANVNSPIDQHSTQNFDGATFPSGSADAASDAQQPQSSYSLRSRVPSAPALQATPTLRPPRTRQITQPAPAPLALPSSPHFLPSLHRSHTDPMPSQLSALDAYPTDQYANTGLGLNVGGDQGNGDSMQIDVGEASASGSSDTIHSAPPDFRAPPFHQEQEESLSASQNSQTTATHPSPTHSARRATVSIGSDGSVLASKGPGMGGGASWVSGAGQGQQVFAGATVSTPTFAHFGSTGAPTSGQGIAFDDAYIALRTVIGYLRTSGTGTSADGANVLAGIGGGGQSLQLQQQQTTPQHQKFTVSASQEQLDVLETLASRFKSAYSARMYTLTPPSST